jgi:hypothetical protein
VISLTRSPSRPAQTEKLKAMYSLMSLNGTQEDVKKVLGGDISDLLASLGIDLQVTLTICTSRGVK